MIGALAGIASLLVAGFVFGRVRVGWTQTPTARAARSRVTTAILVAVISFPFITLMLAKLFSSDLLGWVFGLSLIAGIALVPCAAVFYVGLLLASRGAGGSASARNAAAPLLVQVERSTVHASDDAPSKQISVPAHTTLRALVALAIDDGSIPSISGGKATWIVESSGAGVGVGVGGVAGAGTGVGAGASLRPIAVFAQQWTDVKFLVPVGDSVASHFGQSPPRLHLHYRCQDDPHAVVAALEAWGR